MTGTFYRKQLCSCGNHFDGTLEFFDRAEGVVRAAHKQSGSAQVGKMLRALLRGLARRMQWVREQEQGCGDFWLFGAEHAGLASAIRVTAEEDAA